MPVGGLDVAGSELIRLAQLGSQPKATSDVRARDVLDVLSVDSLNLEADIYGCCSKAF